MENENELSPNTTRRESTQDEIKKFKENLLQSVSSANTNSTISNESELLVPPPPRSRSASRAREALCIPANVMAELDENKIFELKEAFLLFDLNGDGYIDDNDLRGTLVSLGDTVDEQLVRNMLSEATQPLDFDAFVNLLGYKTLELDSEETLKAALSRWDNENSGYISEERIRHDLMTWGDRFTEKETDYALDEAPTIDKGGKTMIDYVQFCSQLSGLRKAKK
ncbi:PREDICTED: myosin regulatory light chain, smooth muscle [Papilio xuthus]|uniref:Myosin regulatory light chain, smooth muscle n=1 Tax=Papilio xuthus TaxID=66420 RepID=A0AAJ6ZJQ1_PAPXU|nr:PREDICTED: myosin regulatory light chain, smooth muscle [Papilio xuthus]